MPVHAIAIVLWLTRCLAYEPDTVSVTGRLERHTYPGPPNYESIASGDVAETGFYLRADKPMCASGNAQYAINNVPVTNVKLVQLVLDSSGYARLEPQLGKRVTLRGLSFTASRATITLRSC